MTVLVGVAVLCAAVGRVAPHAYVAGLAVVFMLALGLVWPRLILMFLSASSRSATTRCRVGDTVTFEIDVVNRWPLPLWGIDYSCGGVGRRIILAGPAVLARGRQRQSITVVSDRRGIVSLSGFAIGTSFPFGLSRAQRSIGGEARLIVWPRAESVDPPSIRGKSFVNSVASVRSRMASEGELAGVCGYRRGDAMRSIHWQQTARHDRLIVRERAGSERQDYLVRLDIRTSSYDDEDSFERAVCVTAGMIERCQEQGRAVELCFGPSRFLIDAARSLSEALDALAAVEPQATLTPPPWAFGKGGVLVTTTAGWASCTRNGLQPYLITGDRS